MDNKLKPITVDSRPFSELIRGGYLYVDKTRYIYSLVENGSESKYWFLSRPRRQGKSLLVDILYNLFSGNKDLFKGLYIYEEYSFERFPVIRLNLNNTATYSLEAFLDSFKRDVVFPVAKAYGVEASFPFDAVSLHLGLII